jgi:hypothetical protein
MDLSRYFGRLSRRLIFVCVALAVGLPLLFPIGFPVRPTSTARDFYAAVEELEAGDVVLFSFDYEPDTMAELNPMSLAFFRHAFSRDIKVVAMTNYAAGPGVAQTIMAQTAQEFGKVYGEDYVFLGYNPDWSGTILRLGESIKATFPTDQYGRHTSEIPLLHDIDSYRDIDLLVSISGSALAEYWAIWAGGRYGQKMVCGTTAIQAILIYPYHQTGQITGFLEGLKGAAEYEKLLGREGKGVAGMDAQSTVHALIAFFVLLGNLGLLLERRERRKRERGTG